MTYLSIRGERKSDGVTFEPLGGTKVTTKAASSGHGFSYESDKYQQCVMYSVYYNLTSVM